MATEFVMWDVSTLQDRKVRDLRRDKGYAGVGIYFAIVLTIRKADKAVFDINDPSDLNDLLEELVISKKSLVGWLDKLAEHKLIDPELWESGQVTSERMLREHRRQFEKSQKCSEAGKASAAARRAKAAERNGCSTDV